MVATSDGLEQIIIRGAGCTLISAREFETEVMENKKNYMDSYRAKSEKEHNYEIARQLDLINNENMLK
jgi:predicted RNA-binding protein with PIN domain